MDVRFLGTGGSAGWPQAGCLCASCLRAAAAGGRLPGRVLVDGWLLIEPGGPPRPATPADVMPGSPGGPAGGIPAVTADPADSVQAGYQTGRLPGGWEITAPGGTRLLIAAGPGQAPDPPDGTEPFDLAVLDLLDSPAQLGALRARGLVRPQTVVGVLGGDHRIRSERELVRRCAHWRAVVPCDGDTLRAPVPAAAADDAGLPHRALILGGARSGKSREAELRLAAEPTVTYVAAGPFAGDWAGADGSPDTEWARRVAAHQARRPAWWRTVETTDLAAELRRASGAVLVDGIGTWLAAVLDQEGAWREPPPGDAGGAGDLAADVAGRIEARADELVAAWRTVAARLVAVSDQVGSGIVPTTAAGRLFRDQLGWLNQRLAAESEETVLVAAGQVVSLPM